MLNRALLLFLLALFLPFISRAETFQDTSRLNLPPPSIESGYPDNYFHLQKKIVRWNDRSKLVFVYISIAGYLPNWQPENVQLVKSAFAEWQHALHNRLIFMFVKDPNRADMIVQWWDIVQPDAERGACGLNRVMTWGKYIAQNDIYIALRHATGLPFRPEQIYATALHEIGHSLGIREHSDNPADIMAPAVSATIHLTQRDINTANMIYAHKADYTNPPGYRLSQFEAFKKTQKKSSWLILPIPVPIPL
jgi:hypothetical protein